MTTLADFRSRVLYALGVTVSTERGFDNNAIDKHTQQAVEEFSIYVPIQATADVNVTAGQRTFALAALTRPIRVIAAEYPRDLWPRQMLDFDVWANTITFDHAPPAAGYTVRLFYHQQHLVDGSGSTIETEHENVIVEGATAIAILARSMGAANSAEAATVAPQTYQHLRVAQERFDRWRTLLRDLNSELRRRQLYSPSTRPLGRDIVSWPS